MWQRLAECCHLLWGFLAITLPVAQLTVSKNVAVSPIQQGLWLGQAAPAAMDTKTDPDERTKHLSLQRSRSSSNLPLPWAT